MAVALVGPAPLDELEALVRDKFGPIVAKEAEADAPVAPAAAFGVEEAAVLEAAGVGSAGGAAVFRNPFPPRFMPSSNGGGSSAPPTLAGGVGGSTIATAGQGEQEPAVPIVRVVPLRDKRELRLVWALPPVRPHYRAPPTRYVWLGLMGPRAVHKCLLVRPIRHAAPLTPPPPPCDDTWQAAEPPGGARGGRVRLLGPARARVGQRRERGAGDEV